MDEFVLHISHRCISDHEEQVSDSGTQIPHRWTLAAAFPCQVQCLRGCADMTDRCIAMDDINGQLHLTL